MAVSRVGSAFFNASPTSSANPTFTLPAGISNGDYGILVLAMSSTSTTPTLTGWTVSTAFDNSTNERTFILTNTNLSSTDSGTTKTLTLASTRWAIAGAVYTGVAALSLAASTQDTSLQNTWTSPAFIPISGYSLTVCLIGGQRAFGTTDGVASFPSGFTQAATAATNNSGASDVDATIAEKTMGSTSSAQSSSSGVWNGSSRANTYIFTLQPTTTPVSASDNGAVTSLHETASLVASVSDGDTGAAADTATAAAHVSDSDTGSASESATIGISASDNGAVTTLHETVATSAVTSADDPGTGADGTSVVAHVPMDDVATTADLLGVSQLGALGTDAGAGVESVGILKSDLIQLKRPVDPADVSANPPLVYGEPVWDNWVLRVGPHGGGAYADQPYTAMQGPGTLVTKTTSYAASSTDRLIIGNGSSITVTLPNPAGLDGRMYRVKNIHASSLTVATAASTIDGGATLTLAQWVHVEVVSDGTQWLTI